MRLPAKNTFLDPKIEDIITNIPLVIRTSGELLYKVCLTIPNNILGAKGLTKVFDPEAPVRSLLEIHTLIIQPQLIQEPWLLQKQHQHPLNWFLYWPGWDFISQILNKLKFTMKPSQLDNIAAHISSTTLKEILLQQEDNLRDTSFFFILR